MQDITKSQLFFVSFFCRGFEVFEPFKGINAHRKKTKMCFLGFSSKRLILDSSLKNCASNLVLL